MPPRKNKPPTPPDTTPAARKATPPKPAARKASPRKATPRKPAARPRAATAPAIAYTPTDEQAFLTAIWKSPDDLTVHLAYADWLTEAGHEARAAALRAWVGFVRLPFRADAAADVLAALRAYWAALTEKEARWLEALEKLRPWVPLRVAEKVVRVCLADVYGPAAAEAWSVEVTRCYFDDRWHGAYRGEAAENGTPATRTGAFFVNPLTGRPSGHVTTA